MPLSNMLQNSWTLVGQYLGEPMWNGSMVALIAAGAAVVALVLMLASWWYWRIDNRPCNDPNRLFRQLCQVQALNWSERHLLRSVAQASDAPTAADVLVEPRYLTTVLAKPAWAASAPALRKLQEKLFASNAT